MTEQEEQIRRLLDECARLRAENEELRAVLDVHGLLPKPAATAPELQTADPGIITNASSPEEKLALFKSLFRGREDVYARRWERSGKSGYSPAAVIDWQAIRAAKPEERKRVARQTRSLLELTDQAVREHLEGKSTVGIYPLLPDDTCWFLAVDFDKAGWRRDAATFLATCREFNVPAFIERSRSGNGAHVWMFFDRPVAAMDARRLGAALLTRATEARHEIGLDSYDRFFPNQDTVPKGGFGNLIALPLQKAPRKRGNSVFVDDDFDPYRDQWRLLSTVRRIASDILPAVIQRLAPEGNVVGVRFAALQDEEGTDPWLMPPSRKRREKPIGGPFPPEVHVVLSNLIYIEKRRLGKTTSLPVHRNQSFFPIQIFQRERSDLTGAQAQACQDQENRIVASADGRFSVHRVQYLLYLIRRKSTRQGRLFPVGRRRYACGQILFDVSPVSATAAWPPRPGTCELPLASPGT